MKAKPIDAAGDWDDLRVLLAVAREGSFLAASHALGLVTSTVSRRIGALEARTGTRLFDRRPDGVRLTEAGEGLQLVAQKLEAQVHAAYRDLAVADEGLQGVIRVSAGDGFGELLADAAQAFKRQHPGVRFEIAIESRVVSVSSREADLAIRTVARQEPALIYQRVGALAYGLWASRAYLKRAGGAPRSRSALSKHDAIGFAAPLASHPATQWLAELGVARWALLSPAHSVHMAAARAGLGLAALPSVSAEGLVRVLPQLDGPRLPIYLVSNREAMRRPPVRAFADALGERMRGKLGG